MRVRGHLLRRVIPGTSVGIQACRIAVSVSPRFSSCLCSLSLCRDVFLCFQFLYPARYFISLSLSLSLCWNVFLTASLSSLSFPSLFLSLSTGTLGLRQGSVAMAACHVAKLRTPGIWSLSLCHTRAHTHAHRDSLSFSISSSFSLCICSFQWHDFR